VEGGTGTLTAGRGRLLPGGEGCNLCPVPDRPSRTHPQGLVTNCRVPDPNPGKYVASSRDVGHLGIFFLKNKSLYVPSCFPVTVNANNAKACFLRDNLSNKNKKRKQNLKTENWHLTNVEIVSVPLLK
jgi:hypothetical protein